MLSVIVPSYQRMTLLEGCLMALGAQTYREFEVVVAVDGSTDGTVTLLESLRKHSAFPLLPLVLPHGGRSKARNAAMGTATGETLVFVDDDVTLDAETLSRHAAFHDLFKNSAAIGPLSFPDGQTRFPKRPSWINFSGCNASLPRAVALQVGGFDESLGGYGGEDLEFGYRLGRAGVKFRPLPDAGAAHHGARIAGAEKARSAGYQAVVIARKHGSGVATQLGVHPNLLAVKGLYLNPLGDLLLRRAEDYNFERAYLDGARAAWRDLEVEQNERALLNR